MRHRILHLHHLLIRELHTHFPHILIDHQPAQQYAGEVKDALAQHVEAHGAQHVVLFVQNVFLGEFFVGDLLLHRF